MSPVQEVCQQLERDQRFQAFMDWARTADVSVMLNRTADLLNGCRDPYYAWNDRRFLDVADTDGWSTVLSLITQVQKEKEAAVR